MFGCRENEAIENLNPPSKKKNTKNSFSLFLLRRQVNELSNLKLKQTNQNFKIHSQLENFLDKMFNKKINKNKRIQEGSDTHTSTTKSESKIFFLDLKAERSWNGGFGNFSGSR